ncbi:MMB_0454 family protein [[Mycoplasma] anseris]|uniref:Asp23/Gls24 family envelope stress response protein n=1 Tax=[Mycoplasma] anseris TaxID=92400 RepID=A0A2Z4NCD8_9BACT|nr:hypothetical protein [[Mycoplasma] anseris]AWX69231.1 hypothetical protein DP065_00450 [[Mycoplasma] anseris]
MIKKETVKVNTRMNFSFLVEKEVIVDAVKLVFKNNENIHLTNEPNVIVNKNNSNVNIEIKCKIRKDRNFSFEMKQLIFTIEQKVFSLINTKPININLIYEGVFDENS